MNVYLKIYAPKEGCRMVQPKFYGNNITKNNLFKQLPNVKNTIHKI